MIHGFEFSPINYGISDFLPTEQFRAAVSMNLRELFPKVASKVCPGFLKPKAETTLCRQLRILANDANADFGKDQEQLLLQAFQSKEFGLLRPYLQKIIDRLSDVELNDLLKFLFGAHPEEDAKPLLYKLVGLLTSQKIGSAISSEFPLYAGVEAESAKVAKLVRRGRDLESTARKGKLLARVWLCVTSYYEKVTTTVGLAFGLTESRSNNTAVSIMYGGGEWQAQARWARWTAVWGMATYCMSNLTNICSNASYYALEYLLEECPVNPAAYVSDIPLVGDLVTSYAPAALLGGICTFTAYKIHGLLKKNPSPEQLPPFSNKVSEAIEGKVNKVYGRDMELRQVINALKANRGTTRLHPILVGQSGAGKTEVVNALARALASDDIIPELKGKKLHAANTSEVFAGFNKTDLLDAVRAHVKGFEKDSIFFFDEIQSIFMTPEGKEASQVLKSLLDPNAKGWPFCILATTYEEYEKYIASDKAFVRRTTRIDVSPLTDEQTYTVLTDMVRLEAPDLSVDPEAIKEAAFIRANDVSFATASQPLLGKTLLSKAFERARDPKNIELTKQLQKLYDERGLIECNYGIAFGINALAYSEAGVNRNAELDRINANITSLENQIAANDKNAKDLQDLIKKRAETKRAIDLMSIRIEDGLKANKASPKAINEFLLKYHYLQLALDEAVRQKIDSMVIAPMVITADSIKDVIREEKAIMQADKERVAREKLLQEETEIDAEVEKRLRDKRMQAEIERRLHYGQKWTLSPKGLLD